MKHIRTFEGFFLDKTRRLPRYHGISLPVLHFIVNAFIYDPERKPKSHGDVSLK